MELKSRSKYASQVDAHKLVALYKSGKNYQEIADYFGIESKHAIQKMLINLGVPLKNRYPLHFYAARIEIDKPRILEWYVDEGRSLEYISNQLKYLTRYSLSQLLKNLGVYRNYNLTWRKNILNKHKKRIIDMYEMGSGSIPEIAAQFNMSYPTIKNFLETSGVNLRSPSDACKLAHSNRRFNQSRRIKTYATSLSKNLSKLRIPITARQHSILDLALIGFSSREIAQELFLSYGLISHEFLQIYRKTFITFKEIYAKYILFILGNKKLSSQLFIEFVLLIRANYYKIQVNRIKEKRVTCCALFLAGRYII